MQELEEQLDVGSRINRVGTQKKKPRLPVMEDSCQRMRQTVRW